MAFLLASRRHDAIKTLRMAALVSGEAVGGMAGELRTGI
jgi:hypothetical protein